MAAQREKQTPERHRRELRALKTTLAGNCVAALQQIESRQGWTKCDELRQLWAQFAEAKDVLLRPPAEERLPPKPQKVARRRRTLEWSEVLGER